MIPPSGAYQFTVVRFNDVKLSKISSTETKKCITYELCNNFATLGDQLCMDGRCEANDHI